MSDQAATVAIDIRATSKIYGSDRETGVRALNPVSLGRKRSQARLSALLAAAAISIVFPTQQQERPRQNG